MTSPAELQAIREQALHIDCLAANEHDHGEDAREKLYRNIAKSLRSIEAQSDEVRRLRSDIQTAVDLLLAFNKDAHARNPMAVTAIDEFLAYRGLGSQP